MRYLTLMLAVLMAAPALAKTPRDQRAVVSDQLSDAQVEALVEITRAYGYRCDTVSAALPWAWSYGFTLRCNGFRYEYEIEDRGGRWTVTIP